MLKSTGGELVNSGTFEEDHKLVTRKKGGKVPHESQQPLGNMVFDVRALYFYLF